MRSQRTKHTLSLSSPRSFVSGYVFDSETDDPLVGVPIDSSIASAVTDANGFFSSVQLDTPVGVTAVTITINACGGANPCIGGYPSSSASVPLHVDVVAYTKTVYLNPLNHHGFNHADGLAPINVTDNAVVHVPPAGPGGNTTPIFLRVAVVPPHAGPGALRSRDPGPISGFDTLQSLFMVRVCCVTAVARDGSGMP